MRDAYRGGTGAGRRPFPFARTLTNGNGRKEVFFLFFRSFNHGGAKPNIKWYKKNISFLAFFFANDINIYIFAVSNNSNNNPI